jgi:hypothetical protein
MRHPTPVGIFKPKPTGAELKGDTTNKIARNIIEGEAAARNAKTERLRAARLAREAAQPTPAVVKATGKKRTKRLGG